MALLEFDIFYEVTKYSANWTFQHLSCVRCVRKEKFRLAEALTADSHANTWLCSSYTVCKLTSACI